MDWLGATNRPDFVIDATFDLFVELGASDEQCDFPVVYASGVNGVAGLSPQDLAADLQPLFEAIINEIQPPKVHYFTVAVCLTCFLRLLSFWLHAQQGTSHPSLLIHLPGDVRGPLSVLV